MNIKVKQITDWKRVLNAARWTVNKEPIDKEPSDSWKAKMLIAEHSPIRLLEYDIFMEDIPNFVAMHLVRHNQGVEKFVGTHRSDRSQFKDTEVNRLSPTNLQMSCNAQALMNISYKRLCNNAAKETKEVWSEVKNKIKEVDPILADRMVPQCVRLGFCPEMRTCGFVNTNNYIQQRKLYHTI